MTTQVLTEPSICIPRTLANVTWRDVKTTFEQLLGPGTVERVDVVTKNASSGDHQPFCRIFVHFRYWPNTPDIMAIRDRLLRGEQIKIVYDNPWFWKCSASRIPKPEKNHAKTAPFIEFMGQVPTQGEAQGEARGEAQGEGEAQVETPDETQGEAEGKREAEAEAIEAFSDS